jgi:hypothetical protein
MSSRFHPGWCAGGYIEYLSHYQNRLDAPVGLVFRADLLDQAQPRRQWFSALPDVHEEQKQFPPVPAAVSGSRWLALRRWPGGPR